MAGLSQGILRWFYETQKYLKENFDLDTTKPEDIGRLRIACFNINENGKERPIKNGELLTNKVAYSSTTRYAFVPKDISTGEYEEDLNDNKIDTLLGAQKCFNVVKKPDGTYEMQSDLSEEQLKYIYDCAEDGRLFTSAPNGRFGANKVRSGIITISKTGGPLEIYDECNDLRRLSKAQQVELVTKHPEFLKVGPEDLTATMTATKEVTALKDLPYNEFFDGPNYDLYLNRILYVSSAENNVEAVETDKKQFGYNLYQGYFWKNIHEAENRENILDKEEFNLLGSGLMNIVGDPTNLYELEEVLATERLFFYDKESVQLMRVDDIISKNIMPREKYNKELAKFLVKLKNEDNLYCYFTDKNDVENLWKLDLKGDNIYHAEGKSPVMEEPKAPSLWATICHKINKNWYKDTFDAYYAECAKAQYMSAKVQMHPSTNDFTKIKSNSLDAAAKKDNAPKPEVKPQKREVSREKACERIASDILEKLNKKNFEFVLKFGDVKPEEFMKFQVFEKFIETPEMQPVIESYMNCKAVKFEDKFFEFINDNKMGKKVEGENRSKENEKQADKENDKQTDKANENKASEKNITEPEVAQRMP